MYRRYVIVGCIEEYKLVFPCRILLVQPPAKPWQVKYDEEPTIFLVLMYS